MIRATASVAAVLLAAGLAMGQNALGDGRALDRNTQIGGQGINERTRDYRAEFRFRNAIVTGNVPGGAGFRGITGYGLEYDFRQRVGSDDLFSFRRDSFTSGLAGTGIRGTEALQYQFALTVGNEPPRNLRGSLLTSRTGERLTAALPAQVPVTPTGGTTDIRPATAEEAGRYEPGTLLSLRSISAFTADRSLGPTMLQMAWDEAGSTQGMVASPLRGLTREALLGDSELPGLARDTEDATGGETDEPRQGEDSRFRRFPDSRIGVEREVHERLSNEFGSRPIDLTPPEEATGDVPTGLAEPLGGDPTATDPSAAPGLGAMDSGDPFSTRITELQRLLRDGLLFEAGSGAAGTGEAVTPSQQVMEQRIDGWNDLVDTLKTGVGTVAVPEAPAERASAYDLHVDRAQSMMEQGRYFEAEQRFTMALAARPGDTIAAVGRVHAQIGAGLDLSAAVNLRAFLVDNPEFVAARYEAEMLPRADRLAASSDRLKSLLADENARSRMRESALLLAYVSFHRGDAATTALALDRLGEGRSGQRDALVPLLRAVWLEQPEADEPGAGEGEDER